VATAIELFEVEPAADAGFVAAWPGGRLYRALREDAEFRFVAVGASGAPPAFRSHRADYETVDEDGAPDGDEGVLLVSPFAVPDGADAAFLAGWREVRTARAAQRGYQGARLHRSVGPAGFRFVDVARWSSPLALARATGSLDVRAATGELPFPSHPALYLAVDG